MKTGFIQLAKRYFGLVLILLVFILLAFPDPYGRSLYAFSEHSRDLFILGAMGKGQWPLLGPLSSLGNFHFGPVYYYLLYPVAAVFGFAPWSLAAASVLCTAVAVVLIFFMTRTWWRDERLAYLVAALMATSTLTVQFAKYASNPNFVPLFSMLFFFALERLLSQQPHKWRYALLLGLAFGTTVQLHAVPLICLPIVLFLLVFQKKLRLSAFAWVVIVLSAAAVMGPYIWYECTHGFPDFYSLARIAASHNSYTPLFERIVSWTGVWTGAVISNNSFFSVPLLLGNIFFVVFILEAAGFLLVLKYNQHHLKPKNYLPPTTSSVKTVLWYWFWVPTVVLLLPVGALSGLRVYYFFILSPLVFILLGLGLSKMFEKGYYLLVYYSLVVYLLDQVGQMYLYNQQVIHLK